MHNDIDPQAARKIANDRHVNDITTGGSEKEVSKRLGIHSVVTKNLKEMVH